MFNKLLFATSATVASDHAARVAFNMALNYNAHITILHVIGVPTRGFSHFVLDIKTNTQTEINDDYIEWVEEEIRDYYSKQLKDLKSYDIKTVIGHPYREILGFARVNNPDVIILGGSTDNELSYKKNMVGSTIHKITKSSSCPVLLVNRPAASFWGKISNVVFAADFMENSDTTFKIALNLVKQFNCEFHIVKTIDIGLNPLSQDEIDIKIRESYKTLREKYLPSIKAENISDFFLNVWEGTPYIEIVKYARECNADLIVIPVNYRNKNANDVNNLENNVEQIISRSNCPVLSISKKVTL